MSHCFRNSSLTIIWNNLGLYNYKRVKRNLEFRKKNTYFKKRLLIDVQQTFLPRTMEWLRDSTNALEQEDSLLKKGFYNFIFKNVYLTVVIFSQFKIPFRTFVIRQTQIIPDDNQ